MDKLFHGEFSKFSSFRRLRLEKNPFDKKNIWSPRESPRFKRGGIGGRLKRDLLFLSFFSIKKNFGLFYSCLLFYRKNVNYPCVNK